MKRIAKYIGFTLLILDLLFTAIFFVPDVTAITYILFMFMWFFGIPIFVSCSTGAGVYWLAKRLSFSLPRMAAIVAPILPCIVYYQIMKAWAVESYNPSSYDNPSVFRIDMLIILLLAAVYGAGLGQDLPRRGLISPAVKRSWAYLRQYIF